MSPDQKEFPEYLLFDVCWDFTGQDVFSSREEFETAVKQYNIEAFEEEEENYNFDDEFDFQEIILEAPVVIINYLADPWDGEEQFHLIEIESDNQINFSNGELLYKFHNLTVGQLKKSGHCYFEGMSFVETDQAGKPLYEMIGGS